MMLMMMDINAIEKKKSREKKKSSKKETMRKIITANKINSSVLASKGRECKSVKHSVI